MTASRLALGFVGLVVLSGCVTAIREMMQDPTAPAVPARRWLYLCWAHPVGRWCNGVLSCTGGVLLALSFAHTRGVGRESAVAFGVAAAVVFAVALSLALDLLGPLIGLLVNLTGWLCISAVLGVLAVAGRAARWWPAR